MTSVSINSANTKNDFNFSFGAIAYSQAFTSTEKGDLYAASERES